MLDARNVALQAGDATTGFYAPDPDEPLPGESEGDRPRWLEGYSWRGLTSGSPLQALWVFLAPFALANTAAAMRPPVDPASRGRYVARFHAAMVRVFALSLGLTLVMAAYVAAIDQLAWQCGNNPACINEHSLTKFLGWTRLASPPRRIAVSLVLPLAVILTLWFLARRGWKARAAVLAIVGKRYADPKSVVDHATALDHPSMWDDREPSEFLRHLHVGAGFSLLSAMTAVGVAYVAAGSSLRWRTLAGVAFALLAVAVVSAMVGWGERMKRLRRALSVGVLVASVVVFVVLVVMLLLDPAVQSTSGVALPGVETVIVVLFLVQLVVMIVVGIAAMLPWSANREHGVGLAGAGSALVCGLALVLGAMFSAGVVLRFGDYLGQSTTALASANTPGAVPIIVPNALTWAALGTAFMFALYIMAALVAAVVVLIVVVVRSVPKIASVLRGFFRRAPAPDTADTERAARARQVARAVRFARLTDRIGRIVLGPALVAAGVAFATTAVVVLIDTHHYKPAFEAHHRAWIAQHAASYGSWIITGFALATLLVVLRARSNARLRRTVGILWDLTTFWPRHAQPLGPPCYTDRALPEFVFRTSWHAGQGHDVMISADSQGTIIAATAVLQLSEPVRGQVAFLTYGSPLHRLYAPWFPAYFNVATFAELDKRLENRWENLYRNTDPIGGRIPPGPPTNVEIVPVDAIANGDFVYPPIRVHSDYPSEPAYRRAVSDLDRQLRAEQPPLH